MKRYWIDIKIENENELVVSYNDAKEDTEYAFYLLWGKEVIKKIPYSEDLKAEFHLAEYGEYRVKIYEQKKRQPIERILTDSVFVGKPKKTYKGTKEVVIKAENVTKKYRLYKKTSDRLKSLFSLNKNIEYHLALKNISFEVQNGEVIGIIWVNGSGKSTLFKSGTPT